MSRHEDVYQDFERMRRKQRRLNFAYKSAVVLLAVCLVLFLPLGLLAGLQLVGVPVEINWYTYLGTITLWAYAELLMRKR